MVDRFLCIHGHFYQPPREDPFTGQIPSESGAEPYKNFNERIQAECYKPNAELGNFERISFNIGPTLFEWMRAFDLQTSQSIVAQDQAVVHRYGVGSAMAQAYNHTILPLASRYDKVTQVFWGMRQFETRFGRKPQGMWLPETAADLSTLAVLAELGIEYTILAPWQAERAHLDPTEAYQVELPNQKRMSVFFYHQGLSTGVSFEPTLTSNADAFVRDAILANYPTGKGRREEPQLLMIASDGELYGHHQHFRDHFLAHLANGASSRHGIQITYPALWLKEYPPRQVVRIRENTSWSCLHGVTRWMGPCECISGNGLWKSHLRQGLNSLASEMDLIYADMIWGLGCDPWKLRNAYIEVILGNMTVDELVQQFFPAALTSQQLEQVQLMLQAQNERQKMFTSCGFYHEDFARIEPRNNLAYAAKGVWLVRKATGIDLGGPLLNAMRSVVSGRTGLRGDVVLQRHLLQAEELGEREKLSLSGD